MDHHANIDPWRRLAVERGVTIRTVRMDTATGQLNWEDLERFIGPKTKLVAIGAASNALGTINDLKSAIAMAHNAGALVFVDAVHYAPHALIDVKELDCDFLGMSAYKFYGPHIGVLFAKRALFEQIDFPKLVPAPDYARRTLRQARRIRKEWWERRRRSIFWRRWAGSRTGARVCARLCRNARAQLSIVRAFVEGVEFDAARHSLWSTTRFAAHTDAVVHDRRLHFNRRRAQSRGKGTLPVTWRLLRLHDRAASVWHPKD